MCIKFYIFIYFPDSLDVDVLTAYLKAHPRVFPEAEGRIKFVKNDDKSTTVPPRPHVDSSTAPQSGNPIIVHRCPAVETNTGAVYHSKLTLLILSIWFIYRLLRW